jgi:hypothetical protein
MQVFDIGGVERRVLLDEIAQGRHVDSPPSRPYRRVVGWPCCRRDPADRTQPESLIVGDDGGRLPSVPRAQPAGVASASVTRIPRLLAAAGAAAALTAVSGCGFIAAGQKSVVKPSSFVLIGHADVSLPASDHAAVGTTCTAPASITGIGANTPIKVLDDQGIAIANGVLGSGILARTSSATTCAFPFEIRAVPGSSNSYGVQVGDRPAQTFAAAQVRQNAPAVITISK